MGEGSLSAGSVVMAAGGVALILLILLLRSKSRSSTRGAGRAGAGLGSWPQWKRHLGFKKAVKRARERIPPYPVADADFVSFFGHAGKHDLFLQHEDSVVVIGPARSGKTRLWCARAVASAVGAVIATSTKVDLIEATIMARLRKGAVLVLDPMNFLDQEPDSGDRWNFGPPPYTGPLAPARRAVWRWRHRKLDVEAMRPMDLRAHVTRVRWNPIPGCEDPDVALRRAELWAEAQPMQGVKNQDWWTGRAAAGLARLMHAAALDGQDILTVAGWGQNLRDVAPAQIIRARSSMPSWATLLEQYQNNSGSDTTDSIAMSIAAILSPLDSPKVVHALTPGPADQFDMTAFVSCHAQPGARTLGGGEDSRDTLYLLASKRAGKKIAPFFAMLMSELEATAAFVSQTCPRQFLWPPLRIVGDELPQMAPLKDLDESISDSGGRGIQWHVIVQTTTQLVDRYGKEAADTILGSSSMRVYLPGIREEGVQRDLNRLAGKKWVRVASGSHSSGSGEHGGSSSTSWSMQKEDVLDMDRIREIEAGTSWMEYRNLKIGQTRLPQYIPEQFDPAAVSGAGADSNRFVDPPVSDPSGRLSKNSDGVWSR